MSRHVEFKQAEQITDLLRRNNQLIRERDAAMSEVEKLLEGLRDIAYAPESEARILARRTLAKFDLTEKENVRAESKTIPTT